jgi:hypothetical protein
LLICIRNYQTGVHRKPLAANQASPNASTHHVTEAMFDNGTSGVSTRLMEHSEGRRLFDKLRRIKNDPASCAQFIEVRHRLGQSTMLTQIRVALAMV